jgi:hypothetical protein
MAAAIQVAMSAIGIYNLVKGAYNIYCDAENMKKEYIKHQKELIKYKTEQQNLLSNSQFISLTNSMIIIKDKDKEPTVP